jgi:PAS domain S-box-containing protein
MPAQAFAPSAMPPTAPATPAGTRAAAWRGDRLGLTIIVASLAVIALILAYLFHDRQQARVEQIRGQGLGIARLAASLPYDQLAGRDRQGVLQVIRQSHASGDFAYAAVVDTQGNPINEETASGVLIPTAAPSREPNAWLGERQLSLASDGRAVLEFHAPLLRDGELVGHFRLGYLKPGFGLDNGQLSFFATLALPIFLLASLFYLLLRREIRPLGKLGKEMETLARQGEFQRVQVEAGGELGDFIRRFNQFMERAQDRIHALESEHTGLQTSTKLLSYRRERIEAVLQSLPEAVLVLDETGEASFANSHLADLFGVQPDQVLGRKPRDWCPNPDVLAFLSRYEVRGQAGYHMGSLEFRPPEAPDTTISVKAYPLFSPHDQSNVFGTLVLFRDVSVEHLAKNARAEFVAHVAHELKTPLNVMAMYSEALQGEEGQDEGFRVEAYNVLHDEVERVSMLINNLLSITKIEMGSLEVVRQRVRPRDLLEDAFNAIARSGRAGGLSLNLDLPREMTPISVDKDLLRIAVNNLLTNAVKYNRPGGSVTLSAEETDDALRIRVRDTGIGIGADDRDKVFDKFYRSNDAQVRSRTGHGLGLSLTRDIIQLHHGRLSVDSTPGEGSEFTIELDKEAVLLGQAGNP